MRTGEGTRGGPSGVPPRVAPPPHAAVGACSETRPRRGYHLGCSTSRVPRAVSDFSVSELQLLGCRSLAALVSPGRVNSFKLPPHSRSQDSSTPLWTLGLSGLLVLGPLALCAVRFVSCLLATHSRNKYFKASQNAIKYDLGRPRLRFL